MYQKRNYGRKTQYSGGGGIDWKRTILFLAIWFVVINAIIWLIGFKGIFIIALLIIAWMLGPKLLRNVRISRRDKEIRGRDPVDRSELIDLD